MQFNTEEENVMMKLFTVIVRVPAVVGIATGAAAITVLLSQTIGWWLPFALVGSALLLRPTCRRRRWAIAPNAAPDFA